MGVDGGLVDKAWTVGVLEPDAEWGLPGGSGGAVKCGGSGGRAGRSLIA